MFKKDTTNVHYERDTGIQMKWQSSETKTNRYIHFFTSKLKQDV